VAVVTWGSSERSREAPKAGSPSQQAWTRCEGSMAAAEAPPGWRSRLRARAAPEGETGWESGNDISCAGQRSSMGRGSAEGVKERRLRLQLFQLILGDLHLGGARPRRLRAADDLTAIEARSSSQVMISLVSVTWPVIRVISATHDGARMLLEGLVACDRASEAHATKIIPRCGARHTVESSGEVVDEARAMIDLIEPSVVHIRIAQPHAPCIERRCALRRLPVT
jgi:hypothetical protein